MDIIHERPETMLTSYDKVFDGRKVAAQRISDEREYVFVEQAGPLWCQTVENISE